jgi:chemotaxis protein methyltransferase CheR
MVEKGFVRDEDVNLLLNDLVETYGYDFTNYARASLKRRISRLMSLDRFPSFAELRYRVRTDPGYLMRFVEEVTVNVTEMFRDPGFYRCLRSKVCPVLATYPLIRIWHAGCSTGEEVYSMAILLSEANLLHKSILYATDLNPDVLERARSGIFPLSGMKQYSENYIGAGGTKDFSTYYSAKYDHAKFSETLKSRMVFATHNLVSDKSFNEFQLILCRNVLIYFDKPLQEHVLTLFDQSLENLGFLALGSKETVRFSALAGRYKQTGKEKIWRKMS